MTAMKGDAMEAMDRLGSDAYLDDDEDANDELRRADMATIRRALTQEAAPVVTQLEAMRRQISEALLQGPVTPEVSQALTNVDRLYDAAAKPTSVVTDGPDVVRAVDDALAGTGMTVAKAVAMAVEAVGSAVVPVTDGERERLKIREYMGYLLNWLHPRQRVPDEANAQADTLATECVASILRANPAPVVGGLEALLDEFEELVIGDADERFRLEVRSKIAAFLTPRAAPSDVPVQPVRVEWLRPWPSDGKLYPCMSDVWTPGMEQKYREQAAEHDGVVRLLYADQPQEKNDA